MSAPHPDRLDATLGLVVDLESGLRQFELTGQCPKEEPIPAEAKARLPMVIWVDLNDKARPPADFQCDGRKFVVPRSIANAVRDRAGYPRKLSLRNIDACVCEHMGHLIE